MRQSWRSILLVSLAILGAACSDPPSSSRRGAGYLDGGVCIRDLEELTELLVHPRSCVDSEQCPWGSFCNESTGACDWQCYGDSDCGIGGVCDCEGRCISSDAGGPGPSAPACERDESLLIDIAADPRPCAFDDECPHGSRCDSATRSCAWDCLSTSHATEGCSGGFECDCFGRCVAPDAQPPAVDPSPRLRLTVSPSTMPVTFTPPQVWAARRIDVDLATESATLASASSSAATAVTVTAGAGLEVTCDPAGRFMGPYGPTCTLTAWSFPMQPQGTVFRASKIAWVRPISPLTDDTWSVQVSAADVAGSPATVSIAEVAEADPQQSLHPWAGEYEGTLRLLGVTDAAINASTPDAPPAIPLEVAVEAWVTGASPTAIDSSIHVYDPIGLLAPGGVIPIPQPSFGAFVLLVDPANDGSDGSGNLDALVETITRTFVPESGVISGELTYEVPLGSVTQTQHKAKFRFAYHLRRRGDTSACSAAAPCDDGLACRWGVCQKGDYQIYTGSGVNTVAYGPATAWNDALAALADRTIGVPGDSSSSSFGLALDQPYDRDRGFASYSIETHDEVIASQLLASRYNTDEGWNTCMGGFIDYLLQLDNQHSGAVGYYDGSSGFLLASPLVCDRLYSPASGPGQPHNTTWRQNYAPCIEAVPIVTNPPAAGHLAALSNVVPRNGTCQRVHENFKASLSPAQSPVPLAYTTFLANHCVAATERVAFTYPGSQTQIQDRHVVYLCPFKEPGLATLGAAAAAERAMCFEAGYEGAQAPLSSSRFLAENLSISGEPICVDGTIPHGVDLVTRQDRLDALGLDVSDAELAAVCLDDLAALPPDLNASDLLGTWDGHFETRDCFSPGAYYHALQQLAAAYGESQTSNAANDPRIGKLLQRVLAQWLALHGYLAKKGAGLAALQVALQYDGDPEVQAAAASAPSMTELLDREVEGWNLVLAFPHAAKALGIPDAAVLSPDYRLAAGGLEDDQAVGLPALLYEAAILHLELVDSWLDQAALDAYAECSLGGASTDQQQTLIRVSRALRWTLAAEALAVAMYDQATTTPCVQGCPSGTTCGAEGRCEVGGAWYREGHAWQGRYELARDRFQAVRQRVVEEASRIARCEVPIALAIDEVPLYFGDPSGDSARFFASSDYLLSGWAIPAVESARSALAEARTAWIQKRDSELQQELSDLDAERRIEAIAAQYGRPLIDMCGLVEVEARDALEAFTSGQLDVGACFIDTADPVCTLDASSAYAWITDLDDIRFELCYWNELFDYDGASGQWPTMADGWAGATTDALPNPTTVTANGVSTSIEKLYTVATLLRGRATAQDGRRALARCADLLGGVQHTLPVAEDGDPHIADRAHCYRGQLGEALLGIAGAQKNVEIAVSSWRNAQERYDQKMEACIDLQTQLGEITLLSQKHADHMASLQSARDNAEAAGAMLGFTFDTMMNLATGNYTDIVGDLAGFAFGMSAESYSDQMEAAQRAYDAQMVERRNRVEVSQCFHEADQYAIGIDTAALQIEAALIEADRHAKRFENMQRSIAQILVEGPAAVEREEGRTVTDLSFHYWLDDRVDRYTRELAWARQLTFLAMRAVEYEFQQSFAMTEEILEATHPDALEAAIQFMEQETLTRTINGRRPEDSILVLSLRDEILRLEDRTDAPAGERDWPAVRRFQQRLWSPDYAVYDDDGRYLGQGVPFALREQGALVNRCAERVWRVTATLQGDLREEQAPAAPVLLVKRNSFASQWCDGRGPEDDYQLGSVPPTSHLFHPEDRGGSEAATITHTTAMMMPWFNVRRSDFYREGYEEGGSDELAGRGLYGQYVLLFPWDGLLDGGFPLEQVEDVLIRFDYLSVDDLPL
jgi:hypothetical protein